MIKSEYMILLRNCLEEHPITIRYDNDSTKRLIAEIFHFLLFFLISIGLLFRKFVFVNSESQQSYWDLGLSMTLLGWSLFVIIRALFLMPKPGTHVQIDKSGVSVISEHRDTLLWESLRTVYVWPWCVEFRGEGSTQLRISFLHREFDRTKRLFALLVTSPPKDKLKAFNKELEIKNLFSLLGETRAGTTKV